MLLLLMIMVMMMMMMIMMLIAVICRQWRRSESHCLRCCVKNFNEFQRNANTLRASQPSRSHPSLSYQSLSFTTTAAQRACRQQPLSQVCHDRNANICDTDVFVNVVNFSLRWYFETRPRIPFSL